jgi:hypothetical protein
MRTSILKVASLAALALLPWSAQAATSTVTQQVIMCASDPGIGPPGARTIGGTLSAVPSGTVYVLNGQGCAAIAKGDVGYFQSQGFTPGSNLFTIQYAGVTSAASATTQLVGTLPAGAIIQNVILAETAGAAITGGVDIGTTASGTNYVSAQALGANGLLVVADSALTRIVGSSGNTTAQSVYVTCHTSCNAGSVTITILWSYM